MSRENNLYNAKEGIAALAARNIEVPARVADALAALRDIEAAEPAKPEYTTIRSLYRAGADQKQLDAALLADLGYTRLHSEWTQARIDAAGAVLVAIRDSANEIFPALRDQADAAIEKLTQIADLGAGVQLDTLIRSGRTDQARLVADLPAIVADLDSAYNFRDRYLTPGGARTLAVANINASRWADPEAAAEHARGKTVAGQYLAGLRAGLVLHFPSPQDAIAAAQEIANRRAGEAQQRAREQHGVGYFAAFG
jgi:hypothetical protein